MSLNFKHILHLILNFLSLTWNMYCASLAIYKSCVSTANFQQVNADWVESYLGPHQTFLIESYEVVVQKVFCKQGVLRNFAKFTGKHLCYSLFCNKVAGPRVATLLKKETLAQCFPVNFAKFLRTTFYIEHLWWLLLSVFTTIAAVSSLLFSQKFSIIDIWIRLNTLGSKYAWDITTEKCSLITILCYGGNHTLLW